MSSQVMHVGHLTLLTNKLKKLLTCQHTMPTTICCPNWECKHNAKRFDEIAKHTNTHSERWVGGMWQKFQKCYTNKISVTVGNSAQKCGNRWLFNQTSKLLYRRATVNNHQHQNLIKIYLYPCIRARESCKFRARLELLSS